MVNPLHPSQAFAHPATGSIRPLFGAPVEDLPQSVVQILVQWNTIVDKDPALGVQMFKKGSLVYVESDTPEPAVYYDDPTKREATEPVRLHPALQMPSISYTIGSGLDGVFFESDVDEEPKLVNLAIANDFVSIPMVTTLKINHEIKIPSGKSVPNCAGLLTFTVKNSEGVRVVDFFSQIEAELDRPLQGRYGATKWKRAYDIDLVNYEGAHELFRKAQTLLSVAMNPSG
ncbi:hypothetical protein B0H17DRAFT_1257991 [Mycena rosella]|uniref:Uncharacterized protein n=1 Tax=Mycena rosella TaxID=1033263 RepID=A0AAD7DV81_MYCRO|nr:hypothetical protein B0H17DRAFT_1257991 [Mycena rosella]